MSAKKPVAPKPPPVIVPPAPPAEVRCKVDGSLQSSERCTVCGNPVKA